MAAKEATARIRTNKLLEAVGWRFFEEDGKPADVCLGLYCKVKQDDLDTFGENSEWSSIGFGSGHFVPAYKTSKARVCVTVRRRPEAAVLRRMP